MRVSTLSALALSAPWAASLVAASIGGAGYDTSRVGPSNADCTRTTYQLAIESNTTAFDASYTSNINEDYVIGSLTSSSAANFSNHYETGARTNRVARTYNISGTLCTPKGGAANASHVHYWDFVVGDAEEYSYVRASAAAGISTFRYDRLGTGLSEKPADSYNFNTNLAAMASVVQSSTDLAIAQKLLTMLRSGGIGGRKFAKVVGVGHSYGSLQMQALSATLPAALDGIVLQGFSVNATAQPLLLTGGAYSIATQVFPARFAPAELTNGYLVTGLPQTNQLGFFHYPGYAQAAFARARATEQPVSQAVLFTQGALVRPAPDFKGPVHVVTGDKDFIFCLGNCYAVPRRSAHASVLDGVAALYPAARKFSTYLPADTGHATNQHLSAPATFREMLAFVEGVLADA
ncbi:hypothetical protein HWV62_39511 [Athelia sp. TMB]|nr:hypothetical protein HWV62_39511 [Athelia sp. TMB]